MSVREFLKKGFRFLLSLEGLLQLNGHFDQARLGIWLHGDRHFIAKGLADLLADLLEDNEHVIFSSHARQDATIGYSLDYRLDPGAFRTKCRFHIERDFDE